MVSLPGTTPLRKAVIAKAQQYLDRLAKDAGDDPALSTEIADSYFRLSMVLGYPYRPNLGDTHGAIASMDKARAGEPPSAIGPPVSNRPFSGFARARRLWKQSLTRATPIRAKELQLGNRLRRPE
jgi:hypothetical protein